MIAPEGQERDCWLALAAIDRARACRAFMAFHGLRSAHVAARLNFSSTSLQHIIQGVMAPAPRIAALIDLGFPPELLPAPTSATETEEAA